jgi:hypothetical protein
MFLLLVFWYSAWWFLVLPGCSWTAHPADRSWSCVVVFAAAVSQINLRARYASISETTDRLKGAVMAELLEVASIEEVATKRTVRSRELDQWLDGGVWKLRPGTDYDVETEVMQRRLYSGAGRRKVSVAVRVGSDIDAVFVVVQAQPRPAAARAGTRLSGGKAGR